MTTSVKLRSVPADTRNGHLLNIGQKRYCLSEIARYDIGRMVYIGVQGFTARADRDIVMH
jgi:hypothetical protein